MYSIWYMKSGNILCHFASWIELINVSKSLSYEFCAVSHVAGSFDPDDLCRKQYWLLP